MLLLLLLFDVDGGVACGACLETVGGRRGAVGGRCGAETGAGGAVCAGALDLDPTNIWICIYQIHLRSNLRSKFFADPNLGQIHFQIQIQTIMTPKTLRRDLRFVQPWLRLVQHFVKRILLKPCNLLKEETKNITGLQKD